MSYRIKNAPAEFDGTVRALHVSWTIGRFGNHVKTITHAVILARQLAIRRVYLKPLDHFEIAAPIHADGVTLLPEHMLEQEQAGAMLSGSFYHQPPFGEHMEIVREEDGAWAIRNFVRPLFRRKLQAPTFAPGDTDRAIHIRAGDIFASPRPHLHYVQPPLAFYQLCVGFARERLGITRVILLYENELNPCIGALKAWPREIDLPFLVQSADLAEDLAVLMAARHCVFGTRTFGPAIIKLSDCMATVFYP
ncbi:MAG: hypothetical protein ACREEP_17195 [Dongiaceae bacterium]